MSLTHHQTSQRPSRNPGARRGRPRLLPCDFALSHACRGLRSPRRAVIFRGSPLFAADTRLHLDRSAGRTSSAGCSPSRCLPAAGPLSLHLLQLSYFNTAHLHRRPHDLDKIYSVVAGVGSAGDAALIVGPAAYRVVFLFYAVFLPRAAPMLMAQLTFPPRASSAPARGLGEYVMLFVSSARSCRRAARPALMPSRWPSRATLRAAPQRRGRFSTLFGTGLEAGRQRSWWTGRSRFRSGAQRFRPASRGGREATAPLADRSCAGHGAAAFDGEFLVAPMRRWRVGDHPAMLITWACSSPSSRPSATASPACRSRSCRACRE